MTAGTELIKKLQIKAGTRLWLINAPAAVAKALSAGAEVEIVKAGEVCDGWSPSLRRRLRQANSLRRH
jgi:hypothetical protein